MEIVSVGPNTHGPEGLRRELAEVAARVDGNKLTIVYLPVDIDPTPYLSAAADGIRGPVIGMTTGGAAFTERGCTRTEPVAAVLGGRDFGFTISVAHDLSRDPASQVKTAARRLVDASYNERARSPVMMVLADSFGCDGDGLYAALQHSVPPHWRIFGGAAGTDGSGAPPRVFAGTEQLRDAAVLLGLFTDAPASLVAHHGWAPVERGRMHTVTESEGSVLVRLDGMPAAQLYRSELVRLGLMQPDDDLVRAMSTTELGVQRRFSNQLEVRAPMSVREDGAIVLAGALAVGTKVQLVTASPDRLIEAARNLSTRVLEPMGGSAMRGALVFDCAARLTLLGERYGEQAAALLGGRHFPMIGVAGYGELAKYAGSLDGFHNATTVMAAW